MISHNFRKAFYCFAFVPMRISAWVYRHVFAPTSGVVKVHLGPGQKNYFEGWINVDANLLTARIDVWADLRRPLPFPDDSVDVFYSHHVIEHLPDSLLAFHFRELFRCLKPSGAIRVGGPNGDVAAAKLLENDPEWFGDFPDKRQSVGGRYANFLLCRGEHLTILTYSYLRETAEKAGFVDVLKCQPTVQTFHGAMIDRTILNTEVGYDPRYPRTLMIEAEKPGGSAPLKTHSH